MSFAGSTFQRGMNKLCWNKRPVDKSDRRVVINNVTLDQSSDCDRPVQSFYKTNRIKVGLFRKLSLGVPKMWYDLFHLKLKEYAIIKRWNFIVESTKNGFEKLSFLDFFEEKYPV